MRTGFGSRGIRNEFDTRGIGNDIRHVGISTSIHTSGVDNTLSVQFGSDKNHLSVEQSNQPAKGYVTF